MRYYSIKKQKQKGFTLIEMMVSIALFTVVMTAALGSILTISDSNKKARSLMSVMTNLNFAVDSMVRSFKTGDIRGTNPVDGSGGTSRTCLTTNEIDYVKAELVGGDEFEDRSVVYCFEPSDATHPVGRITKQTGGGSNPFIDITPPDVDITYLKFYSSGTPLGQQPMITITMDGTVKVSPKISSNFSIQASVSQRKLNK